MTLSIGEALLALLGLVPLISVCTRCVGQRGGRRAVGDDGAVVEGEHAVGEARDDLHVVLDEQHRDLAAAAEPT